MCPHTVWGVQVWTSVGLKITLGAGKVMPLHVCSLHCASFPAEVLWWLTACADSSNLFYMNKSSETADCGGSLKCKRLTLIQWLSLCKSELWSTQICGRDGVCWISAFEIILCCGRLFSRLMVVFQICFSEVTKAVSFVSAYRPCMLIWPSKIQGSNLLCPATTKLTRQHRKLTSLEKCGTTLFCHMMSCVCSDGLQLEK